MSFKSKQTNWFETYTPRDLTVYAIDALAKTGVVELYHDIWSMNTEDTDYIRSRLDEYASLAKRFEQDLPGSLLPPKIHEESPGHLASTALKTLRQWIADLLSLQRKLKRATKEIDDLKLLQSLLLAIPDHDIDFSWIEQPSEVLYKKLFTCPPGQFNHPSGKNIVVKVFPGEKQDFILVLGTPDQSGTVESAATLIGCNEIVIPSWLSSRTSGRVDAITQRLKIIKDDQDQLETRLTAHKQASEIKTSLASVRLLNWYLDNSRVSSHDNKVCHMIGWTSVETADELEDILKQAGIEAVVLFSEKPIDQKPPVESHQPWWARPFGLFVDLVGVPGKDEIDPTLLLALIVPLLFGYMFPDVGHGLILVALGLLIGKRVPEALLLIPCGLASAAFGVIFGDVFGRHDIIDAIWLKPLQNPLEVLLVPMVFGALLITTGLIFSAIEAHWRGEFKNWLQTEASVLMLYLVLILGIFWLEALWLLVPVILWYVIGTLLACRIKKLSCLIYGFGNLIESVFRLALNSISFIRVGAFALAHSGTSHAANLIADMIDDPFFVIIFLIFSHAFIIALEGLIVFVQTSRLILFEFFIRFLKADGRIFKPMQGLM